MAPPKSGAGPLRMKKQPKTKEWKKKRYERDKAQKKARSKKMKATMRQALHQGPLFSAAILHLLALDVSHLRVPIYKKRLSAFIFLKDVVTYKSFRKDVLKMNGYCPPRPELDGAWIQLLAHSYPNWEAQWTRSNLALRAKGKGRSDEMLRADCWGMLSEAFMQTLGGKVGDNVEQWWSGEALKNPGLDYEPVSGGEEEVDDTTVMAAVTAWANHVGGEDNAWLGDEDEDEDMEGEGEGEEDRMDADFFTLAYRPRHQDDGMGDDMEE